MNSLKKIKKLNWLATIRCIEVIGEAASELNDLTKIKYPGIEWKEAIGMRGKMIHHYEGIQLDIIWDTIQKNIPELLNKMQNEVEIKSEKHKDKSPGMGMQPTNL